MLVGVWIFRTPGYRIPSTSEGDVMNDKLNRRTLGKTAGVLAGGAVAARMTSTAAQEATPSASPVAMETVDQIVSAWPDVPREVA